MIKRHELTVGHIVEADRYVFEIQDFDKHGPYGNVLFGTHKKNLFSPPYEKVNPTGFTDYLLVGLGFVECNKEWILSAIPTNGNIFDFKLELGLDGKGQYSVDVYLQIRSAGYDDIHMPEIKYVHQIQNLYTALTQKKLVYHN